MPAWVSSPHHRAVIVSLVTARKAAGMTQRDVAAKLGKPPSFVGKVEAVERNLSVLEFLAWAKAVGVDPGAMLPDVSLPFDL
jgi:transcriptional regulator with XRE-family HTH domain